MLFSTFFTAALLSVHSFVSSVAAQAQPGACTGACNVHDPALIKRTSDGKYFRFSTGNKISIATSNSLTGPWAYQGNVLPGGSKIALAGNNDLWAPDVQQVGDFYYIYYAVSTFGSQTSAIGVAQSSTMDAGSWTDLGSTGISSSPGDAYNAIDSNVILSEGTYYASFGSFWGDTYRTPMTNPPIKTSGSSHQIAFNNSGAHAVEGSFTYYNAPYYYLFFSSGTCCGFDTNRPPKGAEYRINVCRSSSVNGPYVDATGKSCTAGGGTTVYASHGTVYGPGGQGIYNDVTEGGAILYYHYVDTTIGYGDGQKLFGWNLLDWSTGWPVPQ